MKKFFTLLMIFGAIFFTGCNAESNQPEKVPEVEKNSGVEEKSKVEEVTDLKIKITVGDKIFDATLEDNDSAREFAKKLPLEVTMTELNGNEKYYKFPENFPANDKKIGEIQSGDLMLYSSSYVVLFYKTFSTNYTYTRLGKIDNPAGLSETVGGGNIKVRFEK